MIMSLGTNVCFINVNLTALAFSNIFFKKQLKISSTLLRITVQTELMNRKLIWMDVEHFI